MTKLSSVGKPRLGLVQFLGSNCDVDCIEACEKILGIDLELIWHTETSLPAIDGLIIPGGFSYGDFLRSGALASHTRIMGAVKNFASRGGAIMGICNGFQILTESHLLPGALLKNAQGQFVCRYVDLRGEEGSSGYHRHLAGAVLSVPVAHGEGRYFAAPDDLKKLEDGGQILFRYVENPNGSTADIAGIVSSNGRVMGMMPHPERACYELVGGSSDGVKILQAFLESCM